MLFIITLVLIIFLDYTRYTLKLNRFLVLPLYIIWVLFVIWYVSNFFIFTEELPIIESYTHVNVDTITTEMFKSEKDLRYARSIVKAFDIMFFVHIYILSFIGLITSTFKTWDAQAVSEYEEPTINVVIQDEERDPIFWHSEYIKKFILFERRNPYYASRKISPPDHHYKKLEKVKILKILTPAAIVTFLIYVLLGLLIIWDENARLLTLRQFYPECVIYNEIESILFYPGLCSLELFKYPKWWENASLPVMLELCFRWRYMEYYAIKKEELMELDLIKEVERTLAYMVLPFVIIKFFSVLPSVLDIAIIEVVDYISWGHILSV